MSDNTGARIEFARSYIEGLTRCLDVLSLQQVAQVIGTLEETYRAGRRVFIMGNGGSAVTASHLACDLGKNSLPQAIGQTGRRFCVTALTDNVAWLTALANDFGYAYVFSEQLRNLVQPGDLVIAISGSGNSPNIVEGVRVAKALGARVIGILGFDGGQAKDLVDQYVLVASDSYGYVEDLHSMLGHLITAYFKTLATASASTRRQEEYILEPAPLLDAV